MIGLALVTTGLKVKITPETGTNFTTDQLVITVAIVFPMAPKMNVHRTVRACGAKTRLSVKKHGKNSLITLTPTEEKMCERTKPKTQTWKKVT
jgi:hypothetical protein